MAGFKVHSPHKHMEILEKIYGTVPLIKCWKKVNMLIKEYGKKACKYESCVKVSPQENFKCVGLRD